MKDLNRTTTSVAEQFFISDTQAHDIFTAYVDLPRLLLSEITSIDEAHLDISHSEKYAFVIMNVITREIIDILHNHWKTTLTDCFLHISLEERLGVKYIVSDAYRPDLKFPEEYFPNAVSILDSFHATKYLNKLLNNHINRPYRKFRDKNKDELKKKNHDLNLENQAIKDSKEMVLLRDYRWVLLKNQCNINYLEKLHWNSKLGQCMNTYRAENMFFEVDPSLKPMRELKEDFIDFNHRKFPNEKSATTALDAFIKKYRTSEFQSFHIFTDYLEKYADFIIRSFTTVQISRKTAAEEEEYYARLSNGPM